MPDATPRFDLPFILPGQAQKELFHNDALARVDALMHAAVEAAPLADAPGDPQEGQCWIVATGAGGAWAGKDHHLAAWTGSGWRFVAPLPGMWMCNKAAGYWVHWTGLSWSGGELPAASLEIGGVQVVAAPSRRS